MKALYNEAVGINFSHLTEELGLFPFSCVSGYFFLWDNELPSPPVEPEILVRKEIRRVKSQPR